MYVCMYVCIGIYIYMYRYKIACLAFLFLFILALCWNEDCYFVYCSGSGWILPRKWLDTFGAGVRWRRWGLMIDVMFSPVLKLRVFNLWNFASSSLSLLWLCRVTDRWSWSDTSYRFSLILNIMYYIIYLYYSPLLQWRQLRGQGGRRPPPPKISKMIYF